MADDIKESQMGSGVPVKIRALTADGNSISPTVREVTDAMPVSTLDAKGLMPAGLFELYSKNIYLDPGESYELGSINGFLGIRNSYSWGGYVLYWCSGNTVIPIAAPSYGAGMSVVFENGKYILKNTGSNRRSYQMFKQNIPFP